MPAPAAVAVVDDRDCENKDQQRNCNHHDLEPNTQVSPPTDDCCNARKFWYKLQVAIGSFPNLKMQFLTTKQLYKFGEQPMHLCLKTFILLTAESFIFRSNTNSNLTSSTRFQKCSYLLLS